MFFRSGKLKIRKAWYMQKGSIRHLFIVAYRPLLFAVRRYNDCYSP